MLIRCDRLRLQSARADLHAGVLTNNWITIRL